MLKESRWVIDTTTKAIKDCNGDGAVFKAILRKAHAERLRHEYGLVVQAVTFDEYEEPDPKSALTYRDPTGKPLATKLPPPPIEGPDVKLKHVQEELAKTHDAVPVNDRDGKTWRLGNQGRVHHLLAAHGMAKIEVLYGSIFEGILGERITTRPVEVVDPFPGRGRGTAGPATK